ncbi:MAG: hypothetical protein K2Z80_26560 [Xanthobacteraceae bacterium]|nr:hypothetical protein [Xanthobacteraceae bacterium]
MSSEENNEAGECRVDEWHARLLSFTSDAEKIVAVLQAEQPDVWAQYVCAVAEEDQVSDEVSLEMTKVARRLFPERTLTDLTDLRFRMNDVVAERFAPSEKDRR